MSPSRRALFVVPSAFPVGGLATWLDTLLPDLAARGWDPWLGLPRGRHSDVAAYLELHPYPQVVTFSNPSGTRLGRRLAIERELAALAPDVVVCANVVDVFAAVSALRCRAGAAFRVASSIHSLVAGLFADLVTFAGAIDALVAPNELIAHTAATHFAIPPARIFRGSYGVELRPTQPAECSGTLLDLLWIGRFEQEQKRVSDLPLVLRRLDELHLEWRLTVAGAGPLEGWLREALGSFQDGNRVRFLGAVSPSRVREDLLLSGRVLLLTSEWELGPVVAWEAMGQGLAIVTSRFLGSGLEAGLTEGETCFFFPVGDIAAAAAALARCRAPEVRTRLGRQGWQLANKRYSRQRAAEDWDRALCCIRDLEPRQAPTCEPIRAAGRLDRAMGLRMAETLRRTLGWSVRHHGSGDEWPHTRGARETDREFFDRIRNLDRLPGAVPS